MIAILWALSGLALTMVLLGMDEQPPGAFLALLAGIFLGPLVALFIGWRLIAKWREP